MFVGGLSGLFVELAHALGQLFRLLLPGQPCRFLLLLPDAAFGVDLSAVCGELIGQFLPALLLAGDFDLPPPAILSQPASLSFQLGTQPVEGSLLRQGCRLRVLGGLGRLVKSDDPGQECGFAFGQFACPGFLGGFHLLSGGGQGILCDFEGNAFEFQPACQLQALGFAGFEFAQLLLTGSLRHSERGLLVVENCLAAVEFGHPGFEFGVPGFDCNLPGFEVGVPPGELLRGVQVVGLSLLELDAAGGQFGMAAIVLAVACFELPFESLDFMPPTINLGLSGGQLLTVESELPLGLVEFRPAIVQLDIELLSGLAAFVEFGPSWSSSAWRPSSWRRALRRWASSA